MTTIKGKVSNGRVQVDVPTDLPDGTEFTITVGNLDEDGDRIESPEEIAEWLRWYDSLEPLIFTPEEKAELERIRAEDRQFEIEDWEQRSKKIERLFQ